jgi:hypothetical protein
MVILFRGNKEAELSLAWVRGRIFSIGIRYKILMPDLLGPIPESLYLLYR